MSEIQYSFNRGNSIAIWARKGIQISDDKLTAPSFFFYVFHFARSFLNNGHSRGYVMYVSIFFFYSTRAAVLIYKAHVAVRIRPVNITHWFSFQRERTQGQCKVFY